MAPPVAVYVAVTIVGVAAALAFKEFVYEPHIAPAVEAWAENFLERRRKARNSRASAVGFSSSGRHRRSSSSSPPPSPAHGENNAEFAAEAYELEGLVAREVDEWRNEVLRSQELNPDGLRRRRAFTDSFDGMSTSLDEVTDDGHTQSFTSLTHTPLAPTHVISNVSSPIAPSPISLPHALPQPLTPNSSSTRQRSDSQSTTTQGNAHSANTLFVLPSSPFSSSSFERVLPSVNTPPRARSTTLSSDGAEDTPRAEVTPPTPAAPAPITIPLSNSHVPQTSSTSLTPRQDSPFRHSSFPFAEGATPITPQDSPFGPLLPDTPRSSAEMYGERPFSPIVRVMGPAPSYSGSGYGGSRTMNGRTSSGSLRTLHGSIARRGSGLVNQVSLGGSDSDTDEDGGEGREVTSANGPIPVDASVVSSLSERYPAPPTPPVVVSPPGSSIGVLSPPSSPGSVGGDIDIILSPSPAPSSNGEGVISVPSSRGGTPALTTLQVPPLASRSRSRSRSPVGHSAVSATSSPTLSFASFLSPVSPARTASESEAEFLSIADSDSDSDSGSDSEGEGSPATPHRGPASASFVAAYNAVPGRTPGRGPVVDRAYNPFLDFEDVFREEEGSEHEDGSEGSDRSGESGVVVGRSSGSDEESEGSWGSARGH
ncbi:hypothetical protein HYDPIDRAFT_184301 [Hydnomerulius pinastri MD-312]|nr:hypothetical protein HYDPIDRAFT_184301 [Hydnomerulius pinastri MD-312]